MLATTTDTHDLITFVKIKFSTEVKKVYKSGQSGCLPLKTTLQAILFLPPTSTFIYCSTLQALNSGSSGLSSAGKLTRSLADTLHFQWQNIILKTKNIYERAVNFT